VALGEREMNWLRRFLRVVQVRLLRSPTLLAAFVTALFGMLLVLPYGIWGEQWGMIWFYLTWPTSSLWKFLWDSDAAWPYVTLVTVFHLTLVFFVLRAVVATLRFTRSTA
jgi:hypothetical protein